MHTFYFGLPLKGRTTNATQEAKCMRCQKVNLNDNYSGGCQWGTSWLMRLRMREIDMADNFSLLKISKYSLDKIV